MEDWRTIGLRKTIIVVLVAELVFFASVLAWVFGAEHFDNDHSPIMIDGNGNFTRENGVIRGEGTVDDPYIISGWDIDASWRNGVDIRNTDAHFVVRNVSATNAQLPGRWAIGGWWTPPTMGCGIRLFNVTNGVVENCVLTNDLCGIWVENSSDIVLRGNLVSEGTAPNVENGILIYSSLNVELSGNTLERNGVTIQGTSLEHFRSHSVSDSNTVNGLPIVFMKDAASQQVSGGSIGQLIAVNCTSLMVTGVSVNNTEIGALLAFCQHFVISSSSFADCLSENVRITDSNDGILYRCSISGSRSETGLKIQDSQSIRVEQCMFWDNRWNSIETDMCEEVTVESNRIWGDKAGLHMRNSQHMTANKNNITTGSTSISLVNCNYSAVTENTVTSQYGGLSFSYSTSNVTVAYNTVFKSKLAVQLWEGVDMLTFHHNNFINNTENVKCIGNASAVWNLSYPEGGNYWSNHSNLDISMGEDQDTYGQDGIADTPFVATDNNTDAYPLFAPAGIHASKPIPSIDVLWDHIYPNSYFTVSALESWDFFDVPEDLKIRWDWGNDGTWDTDWTADMSTEHVLYAYDTGNVLVQVRDSAGNVGELLTEVPFDADPPYAAVMADATPRSEDPDNYEGESVIIWWGILDTGMGVDSDAITWTLDGSDIAHGGFSYSAIWVGSQYEVGGSISFFDLSSGSHTFKVTGRDYSGNMVESEITFAILPSPLQTREGVAAVSLGIAAFAGVMAVAIVYVIEKGHHKVQGSQSAGSGDKPQADEEQRPPP